MRLFTNRTLAVAMLAGMGLTISACGKTSTDSVDNSEITDMNAVGTMEGTTNDMSALDMATDTNVATDNATSDNMTADNAASADNAM